MAITNKALLGSSAITAFGSLLSQGINYFANRETNAANAQAVKDTNKQQREMYEDAKRYNSAVEQVARLKAAGLNPALAFGDAGSAPSIPSLSSPTYQPFQSQNPFAGSFDPATLSQIELNKALANKANKDAGKSEAETEGINLQNKWIDILNETNVSLTNKQRDQIDEQIKMIQPQIDRIMAQTDKIRADIRNVDADTVLKNIEKTFQEKTLQTRIKQVEQQYNIGEKQLALLTLQVLQEPERFAREMDLMIAQTNLTREQTELTYEQRQKTIQELNKALATQAGEIHATNVENQVRSRQAETWLDLRGSSSGHGQNFAGDFLFSIQEIVGTITGPLAMLLKVK